VNEGEVAGPEILWTERECYVSGSWIVILRGRWPGETWRSNEERVPLDRVDQDHETDPLDQVDRDHETDPLDQVGRDYETDRLLVGIEAEDAVVEATLHRTSLITVQVWVPSDETGLAGTTCHSVLYEEAEVATPDRATFGLNLTETPWQVADVVVEEADHPWDHPEAIAG